MAICLTGFYCLLVLTLLAATLAGWIAIENLEKFAAVLLAPLIGLLGAVVGFYWRTIAA